MLGIEAMGYSLYRAILMVTLSRKDMGSLLLESFIDTLLQSNKVDPDDDRNVERHLQEKVIKKKRLRLREHAIMPKINDGV